MTTKELYEKLLGENGFSVNPLLETHTGKGYAVSLPGCEKVVETNALSTKIFEEIIREFQRLAQGAYIGAWKDADKVYFDVSKIVENKDEAIKLGQEYKQLAIYDFNNKEVIKL